MDEIDSLLDGIINGTVSAADASDRYLDSILGVQPVDQQTYMPMGHSISNSMIGRGSVRDGITDPSQIQRDENGYITGRAATFATQSDLNNYARTGSLATGDNGRGAWGANTAVSPGVAIPRDLIASVYGNENAGRHRMVEVISPKGTSAVLPILDKGPALRNRGNNALIELTPAATQLLGSGDMGGYRFRFID